MTKEQDEAVAQIVGGVVYGATAALVEGGLSPAAALRIVGYVLVEATLGREAVRALGVPESTARRWRVFLRDALAEAGLEAQNPSPELLASFLTLARGGESDADDVR